MNPFLTHNLLDSRSSVGLFVLKGGVFSLIIFFFCSCAGTKKGPEAQQERRMTERLLNPDRSQASRFSGQQFTGSQLYSNRSYKSGAYRGSKEMSLKTYRTSDSALGDSGSRYVKSSKISKSAYHAREAALANSSYGSKGFESSAYALSDKQTQVQPGVVPVKETEVVGSAQGRLDQISDEVQGKMTIDEIRELLNKN